MIFIPPFTGNQELDEYLNRLSQHVAEQKTGSVSNDSGTAPNPVSSVPFYQKRFLHVKYANSRSGADFGDSPTNRFFYGLYNSDSSSESLLWYDYKWYPVDPSNPTVGFGADKELYYRLVGGRQISLQIAENPPDASWSAAPTSAIDLETIISDNSINNDKLADMPTGTIKGRVESGTGSPQDLTPAQVTELLPVFAANKKGLVPGPTTQSGRFLRDDGTWQPAGGGDADDVSIADAGNYFTGTNVEVALQEVGSDLNTLNTALSGHLSDTTDAHDASAISIVDTANNFTATDVEGALAELASGGGGGGGGGGPPGSITFEDVVLSAVSQSSVYPGVTAATVANMIDGNNATGTGTNNGSDEWIQFEWIGEKWIDSVLLGGGSISGWGGTSAYLNSRNIEWWDGSAWQIIGQIPSNFVNDVGALINNRLAFPFPVRTNRLRLRRVSSGQYLSATGFVPREVIAVSGNIGGATSYAESVIEDGPLFYTRLTQGAGNESNLGWSRIDGVPRAGTGLTRSVVGSPAFGGGYIENSINAAGAPGISLNDTRQLTRFTAEFFMRTPSASTGKYGQIISKSSYIATDATEFPFVISWNDASRKIVVDIDSGNNLSTDQTITSNFVFDREVWYHVAVVVRPTGGPVMIYVNGVLDTSVNAAATVGTGSQTWFVGSASSETGGGVNTSHFTGRIAEPAIYPYDLPGTSIARHYSNRNNPYSRPAFAPVFFQIAASDLTSIITAGTTKAYFRAPHGFTISEVRASLSTAQTSGAFVTVDVNRNGFSIFSTTKLIIDNTEKTSLTSGTPAVLSGVTIADDDEITIDVDQVGNGTARGLIVTIIGAR